MFVRQTQRFLKGPIPMDWLNMAGRLPGKTVHAAICIWHMYGLTGSVEVKVNSKILADIGVSRFAGYRALKALEARGLIEVVRSQGHCPLVTIKGI